MVYSFHLQQLITQVVDAPALPPLADPELFQEVFLPDPSSKKSKFLSQYGDELLKAMTRDILTELMGRQNYQVVSNIIPLAISNAFYEQIVFYYRLDPHDQGNKEYILSKGRTHARGDLFEAYVAAIEKDVSRTGDGYKEVKNWLSKVLTLRLPRITAQKGMVVHSIGTEQKSFTIWPLSSDLKTTTLSKASGRSLSPSEMTAIWRQDNGGTFGQQPIHSSRIITSDLDGTSDDLNEFRQFIFDTMRQVVMQTYESRWELRSFWQSLSDRFSQIQTALEGKSESMLLFYYRVKLPRCLF